MNNLLSDIFTQKEIEKDIFQKKIENLTEQLNGKLFFGYDAEKKPYDQINLSGEIFILCDLLRHVPTKMPYQKLVFSFKFDTTINFNDYDNKNHFFKIIKPAKVKAYPRTEFLYNEELITKLYKLPNCKILPLANFTSVEDILTSILSKTLENTPNLEKWKSFGIAKEYLNGLGIYPKEHKQTVVLHDSFIKNLSNSFISSLHKNNNLQDVITSVNQEILQYHLNHNLTNNKNDIKKVKI